jgi:hypothetical protein
VRLAEKGRQSLSLRPGASAQIRIPLGGETSRATAADLEPFDEIAGGDEAAARAGADLGTADSNSQILPVPGRMYHVAEAQSRPEVLQKVFSQVALRKLHQMISIQIDKEPDRYLDRYQSILKYRW